MPFHSQHHVFLLSYSCLLRFLTSSFHTISNGNRHSFRCCQFFIYSLLIQPPSLPSFLTLLETIPIHKTPTILAGL